MMTFNGSLLHHRGATRPVVSMPAKTSRDVPCEGSKGVSTTETNLVHNVEVTRDVHVPYVVAQDEDGDGWYASAHLRADVAAFGEGATREEAIADLRSGLELLLEEVGPPDELTVTLNVA
jgi:predicted RNase H-like HicB family nuclease